MQADESYFKQKSYINWIREGDQNTKFFQRIVAAKQNRAFILYLVDSEGNRLTTYSHIS